MSESNINNTAKPRIRFKGFADVWEQRTLNNFLEIPPRQIADVKNITDLITLKLNLGGAIVGGNRETLKIGATKYFIRHAGQLIYGKQNFFHGSIAIIPKKCDNKATSCDVPSFNIKNIDTNFLYYYISRPSYYEEKEVYASGTGSKRIHEDTFLKFSIEVPPRDEQVKISRLLETVSDFITLHQRKHKTMQNKKSKFYL